jgi:hypothetical protein
MARYFFHVQGTRPYEDEEGFELADDAAAWHEAKRFARDIESNLQPGETWRLEVRRDRRPVYFLELRTGVLTA